MNPEPVYSHEYMKICYTAVVLSWDPMCVRPETAKPYVSQFISTTLLLPVFHKITNE